MERNFPLALFPFPTEITTSYQIICPKLLVGVADPKKCAAVILEQTGLADDTFRLGNTKARIEFIICFFSLDSNGNIRAAASKNEKIYFLMIFCK